MNGHLCLLNELNELLDNVRSALKKTFTDIQLKNYQIFFLGKNSRIFKILKRLKNFPFSEYHTIKEVTKVRDQIKFLFREAERCHKKENQQKNLQKLIDITLPGRLHRRGKSHVLTKTIGNISDVLKSIGFEFVTGPEIEHDYYNFEALNMPNSHPTRNMHDTFYIRNNVVLRTQTSPVQIRTLLANRNLPIRVASAGCVYRRDQDLTHSSMFHQIEGLYVNRNVNLAQLKGTLIAIIKKVFPFSLQFRIRSSFFPFTEPSCEIDICCFVCKGLGCRMCSNSGFIEVLGAGMVSPNVLKASNVDSEIYTGFAFGIGVERVAMLCHKIDDIRFFFENDIRFLSQF